MRTRKHFSPALCDMGFHGNAYFMEKGEQSPVHSLVFINVTTMVRIIKLHADTFLDLRSRAGLLPRTTLTVGVQYCHYERRPHEQCLSTDGKDGMSLNHSTPPPTHTHTHTHSSHLPHLHQMLSSSSSSFSVAPLLLGWTRGIIKCDHLLKTNHRRAFVRRKCDNISQFQYRKDFTRQQNGCQATQALACRRINTKKILKMNCYAVRGVCL